MTTAYGCVLIAGLRSAFWFVGVGSAVTIFVAGA